MRVFYTYILLGIFGFGPASSNIAEKQVRLIGADPAEAGEFPWIISLQRDKTGEGNFKHFCAGSLVSSSVIVTAAHCLWNRTSAEIRVIAGAINITKEEEGQQRNSVKAFYMHPKYKSKNRPGPYDIAVLKLKNEFILGERVGIIDLPETGEDSEGNCKYAGWGNRFLMSGIYYYASDVLRTVNSTVISKLRCWASYLFVFRRQLQTAICTAAGPLRGSCQGDSGGSLVCYREDGNENTPYLAGVVSWGWIVCGDGIHPDVSTDVSLFVDYIRSFL